LIRTESILINKSKHLTDFLFSSKLIYNQSLYFLRQAYFESKKNGDKIKTPSYSELYKLVKDCETFKESPLDFVVRQSCIKQASNNCSSFIKASLSFQKTPGKFKSRPLIPRYLKNETNLITIDSSRFRSRGCKDQEIRIPKSDFRIKLPNYIDKKEIKCLRIL